MRVSNIKFCPIEQSIRINTGFNGGLPFVIKVSQRAALPLCQMEKALATVAARLAKAPYYDLIKAKTINIWLVSEKDMEEGGVNINRNGADTRYASPEQVKPHFPLGLYEPQLNAVLINSDFFASAPGHIELLAHELLHAYSTVIENPDPNHLRLRSGLMTLRREGGKRIVTGQFLNEGLTEYLRVLAGGAPSVGAYKAACEAVAEVARRVGIKVLIDAYFKGDLDDLSRAVDICYGSGGYQTLCNVAQPGGNELAGFVKYGFEHFAMLDWGYTAEDRRRAPRPLPVSSFPAEIRPLLENFRIYGALDPGELEQLVINLSDPARHQEGENGYSYQNYRHLAGNLEGEKRNGRNFLYIRTKTDYLGRKYIMIETASVDPQYLSLPNFLGHATLGRLLMQVILP